MNYPAALHRLKLGVPATVEHASDQSNTETAQAVAETTQVSLSQYTALSLSNRSASPWPWSEFHHVHGCSQVTAASQRSITPAPARTHDRLCPLQGKCRVAREE